MGAGSRLPRATSSACRSPVPVLREDVISVLHYRVAREPALRVVTLRRIVCRRRGAKRIGRRIVIE